MAATTRANRIHLAGDFRHEEAKANAALSPGHLLEIVNVSGDVEVRKHNQAGGTAERLFAMENSLEGLRPGEAAGYGVTADTAYAAGDLVMCGIFQRGAVVSALLKAGTNYTVATELISAGDGTLQKDTDSSTIVRKDVIGVVLEPLDLSASGATAKRGVVRLL